MEKRTGWVDYAKAIGILLVVYGHVAAGLYKVGIEIPTGFYTLTNSIVYSFHMPLFFFLSGLFFYRSFSKKGGPRLLFSKIDTIFYPYILWSILQGCIEAFLSDYTNGNVSYREVFSLLWYPRAQFWFLYALFFVFVVTSAIYSIVSERFHAIVFLLAVSLYLFPTALLEYQAYQFIAQNLVFFCFGIVFTVYANVQYLSRVLPLLTVSLIFIAGQWFFHGYLSLEYTDKGPRTLLLAFTSIIFVVSISAYLSKISYRWLAFIGSSSMVIYLTHILAGSGARVVLNQLFDVDNYLTHLIVGCLVSVLAPLVFVILANRVKIPYLFSAPISEWVVVLYDKALRRGKV